MEGHIMKTPSDSSGPPSLRQMQQRASTRLLHRSYVVIAASSVLMAAYMLIGVIMYKAPMWTLGLAMLIYLAVGIYRIDLQLRMDRSPKPRLHRSPHTYR